MTRLADFTTLRVGGEAREFFRASTEQELIELVSSADESGVPILVIGGGSNLLISDHGFDGRVIKVETHGIDEASDACSGGFITVQAGENWDSLVAWACEKGFVGLETLAGIPGTVGASPIQNIGAYGHEVSEVIARVRTFDRKEKRIKTLAVSECDFSYRSSRFKVEPDRYLILDVAFQMKQGEMSLPIQYKELADYLSVSTGARAPLNQVREAVLAIRRSKGMVLDSSDRDTYSAGSFFTNPIVDPSKVPAGAQSWPADDGKMKVSAAWLIENAGIQKGLRLGGAGISSKHVLALTNQDNATAEEILSLASHAQAAVKRDYKIDISFEVRIV